MDNGQRKRLTGWLRSVLFASDTKVTKFTISHLNSKGQSASTISSIKLSEEKDEEIKPDNLDELIGKIDEAITCDAEGLGDFQKYVLLAHFSDGETRRVVLSWTQQTDDFTDPLNTEGASNGGLVAQAMRHAEVFMKLSTLGASQSMQSLLRMNQYLTEENGKLNERVLEFTTLVEDLRSTKHEREIDTYQAETKAKVIRDIGEKVTGMLLPILANRLGKGNLLKSANTPREELINTLVTKLKPEQFHAIAAQLDTEQQIILAELVTSFAEPKTDDSSDKNGAS